MNGINDMKSLKELEKSKGVVLFAFNTDQTDYVEIANRAAQLIKHTMSLPVTLITDNLIPEQNFDSVVYIENSLQNKRSGFNAGTQWRNGGRYNAYQLSPYENTLLIDSDFLMLDASLNKLFDFTMDYQIVHKNKCFSEIGSLKMGPMTFEHIWATGIVFKKTKKAKQLFDLVGRIQRNYSYYKKLYGIAATNFRNDFAFAIADRILNGYCNDVQTTIPWSMLTVEHKVKSLESNDNWLILRDDKKSYVLPQQNLHFMDKEYLLSQQHQTFIDTICKKNNKDF